MIDAYEGLIPEYISQEEFFRFGLEKSIYIPDEKVKKEWDALKQKLASNKPLFIRGVKDSLTNQLFYDFYAKVMENQHVKKDPSNTQSPTKIMETLSGYKKSKDLRNYQLASIFSRSRNVLAFNAPWNIVYIPNMIDPLLGPDARGDMALQYKEVFQKHCYEKFKPYIQEFNDMITNVHFLRNKDQYLNALYDNGMQDREIVSRFETILEEEFAPIRF